MKVLMRPALKTIPEPNSIYVTSLKGKNLSSTNFSYEEYKSKLCTISVQEISPTAENRNLFNQRQFRGKAGSNAYVPSYEICKQHLNTTNIHGWEVGKVTIVEPGLEVALTGLLCYPTSRTSSSFTSLEIKVRPQGHVYLRVEYDTPCKQLRVLEGSGVSGHSPVNIKIYFEDGTSREETFISSSGSHSASTYTYDKGIVACELVQRSSSSANLFCSRYFAPVNTGVSANTTRYSPSLDNLYINSVSTISGYLDLDYTVLEMECTHDVQDTSKVFIPRPFFLWQASGSIPPLKIQADVIMEGTKV